MLAPRQPLTEDHDMHMAFSTYDNQLYSAHQFASLEGVHRGHLRHSLQCPECQATAFFRNGSYNGRQPCFGARPHNLGCSLASLDFTAQGERPAAADEFIWRSSQRVVLNLSTDHHATVGSRTDDQAHDDQFEGMSYGGGPTQGQRPSRRKLSTVLRNLLSMEDFQQSQQLVEAPGYAPMLARDFFVPFRHANPGLAGRGARGWWGSLSNAAVSVTDGQLWLNSGGHGALNFVVPTGVASEVLGRHNIGWNDVEALAGAWALVVGEMWISRGGEMRCVVQSPEHVALTLG